MSMTASAMESRVTAGAMRDAHAPSPCVAAVFGRHRYLFPAMVMTAAGAVVYGSYATWATFYAGLVARNGVAGHGKYFIGLSLAAFLIAIASTLPGVSHTVRWLAAPAGAVMPVRNGGSDARPCGTQRRSRSRTESSVRFSRSYA